MNKLYINPKDVEEAALRLAESDNSIELLPPEEDLEGWEVIYGVDAAGKTRPVLLMRTIPVPYSLVTNAETRKDNKEIESLLIKKVYKISSFRTWCIRMKYRVRKLMRGGK